MQEIWNTTGMVAGFAIVATIFGAVIRGWGAIKAFIASMIAYVIAEAKLDDDATSQAVLAHLIKTCQRSYFCQKTFGGRYELFRNGSFGHVPFELLGQQSITFWKKWWCPFWFTVTQEKTDEKTSTFYFGYKPKATVKSSILYIRGTIDIEKIVQLASAERNALYENNGLSKKHNRFFIKRIPDCKSQGSQRFSAGTSLAWYYEGVYRLLSHSYDELGHASFIEDESPLDRLYFPPHISDCIHEIQMWRQLQSWYVKRGIPWKRGWLLYGPPGTGKSAIARAIAEDQDMPLFVFSLGEILNEELERSWSEMQAHTPCIALFEDFDNVFHGRENVYGKPSLGDVIQGSPVQNTAATAKPDQISTLNTGKLSFDCLLNCIDGVEKSNGIFTIITTNHVQYLDPALGCPRKNDDGVIEIVSSRPGRIDKAIELGYLDNENKAKMAQRIFFDDNEGYQEISRLIQEEPDRKETPAQFQERCAQVALKLLWKNRFAHDPFNCTKEEHDKHSLPNEH